MTFNFLYFFLINGILYKKKKKKFKICKFLDINLKFIKLKNIYIY